MPARGDLGARAPGGDGDRCYVRTRREARSRDGRWALGGVAAVEDGNARAGRRGGPHRGEEGPIRYLRGLGFEKAAAIERAAAEKVQGRYLAGAFAAPHQASDFVNLHQPVHAGAQPELVAMILGAEIAIATHTKPAERSTA